MPFLASPSEQDAPEGTVPIPSALGSIPLLGTVPLIDPESPTMSISKIADQYGEIFRMVIPGKNPQIVVSTQALVNEFCDETRFEKTTRGNVIEILRAGTPDSIFTAGTHEEVWQVAHRILIPAFGPVAIQGMFDDMYDIASQMAMKWARHGPSVPIHTTDDLTRMTLDTIALCSMGYRFNSYYHDELHPFILAMNAWLRQTSDRFRRPLPEFMYRILTPGTERKWDEYCAALGKTAREVMEARKKNPTERRDLLTTMLEGVDPKTGKKLTEQCVVDNLVTFLIAGHETTSGMLSFAFVELLKHPEAYRKVQEEVDRVVGRERLRPEHLPKLKYIDAVLKETLRMRPTIPGIGVRPLKDEVVGGKYLIKSTDNVFLAFTNSQLDPKVFGDTAKQFIPERMLDENYEALNRQFPNCWKPFGNGVRGCIGRAFAWQESLMAMAILFQNFNFVSHNPNYSLTIKEALTHKPDGFYMRATLRHNMTPTEMEHRLAGGAGGSGNTKSAEHPLSQAPTISGASTPAEPEGKPMSIYYGSNSGTCEALAHRLAADASTQGFHAVALDVLDAANQRLPKTGDHPVVLITASYEGQPPDNAAHFVTWLENLKGDKEMAGVNYAVFGCGHRDWTRTFHRVPKLIDSKLAELGATRLAPLGVTDAADGNTFLDFETWEFEKFWPALAARYNIEPKGHNSLVVDSIDAHSSLLSVEVSNPRSSGLRQDVGEAVVVSASLLTAPGAPAKRHVEIQLPAGMHYSAGDYLAVLPLNPKASVDRAMRRFGLARDVHITIKSGAGHTTLPTGQPVSAYSVLSEYVELAQPATKRCLLALAEAVDEDKIKKQLAELAGDAYQAEISARRVSVLDLLERFPAIKLPLAAFLAMLPPMRVRQYSISSSPLWNGRHATLTYSVMDEVALSSETPGGNQRHLGVATNYLASLGPGDHLHVAVRPSHTSFHLPDDGEHTPIICVAAGAGIAPFRGFVQERAALLGAGRRLAPMLLYFGCRDPAVDDLYREELDRWHKGGAVSVRRVHSRKPDDKGVRHVQDRLWRERDEVASLWQAGAKVFVCGSRAVGEGVKEAFFQAIVKGRDSPSEVEADREELQEWYETVRNKRYAADVFD